MKNNIKMQLLKTLTLLFMVTGIALIPQISVQAVQNYKLNLDNNFVFGSIDIEKDIHFYSFTISEPSWVTITYQGHNIEDSYYKIKSYDQSKEYFSREVYYSSDVAPKTDSTGQLALEAGTYLVEVVGYGNNTGRYALKGTSTPFKNNEKEPNNAFAESQQLTEDVLVKGLFSMDDRIDFYKIQLNNTQKVHFYTVSNVNEIYLTFYDENFVELSKKNIYYASESAPKTADYDFTWQAGIYYIKVTPSGNSTGTYTLKFLQDILTSSISISGPNTVTAGQTAQMTATINPPNTSNKNIKWAVGNSDIASVDSNGTVTAHKTGKTTVIALAEDGSNVQTSKTIIVTPAKASLSNCYAPYYSKKKLYVSWYSQSEVSGYQLQYSTNKKFKGAKIVKVKKSVNYKNLTKLKSKKKYYVRVRSYKTIDKKTYYGAWSSKKSAKTR